MSQRDLIGELRRGALVAPPELRERVRFIASQGLPPRRRVTRRRAFAIAVPILAAAVAATVVMSTRSPSTPSATREPDHGIVGSGTGSAGSAGGGTLTTPTAKDLLHHRAQGTAPSLSGAQSGFATDLPAAPSATRAQRYSASLALAVASADDVVSGSKRAVQIAQSEGGFLNGMNTNVAASKGYADLTLRVPRENVQQTMARLASLGSVTGENVTIQDLQNRLDATSRLLHRLRTQLATLETEPQTSEITAQIAAIEAHIARLQRNNTATVQEAKFATVYLELSTKGRHAAAPASHGPFHNIGTAFRAIGIGLVYGLVFGLPLLLIGGLIWLAYRGIHRRRENELLGTS